MNDFRQKLVKVLITFIALLRCTVLQTSAQGAHTLLIQNIHVIPMDKDTILPNRDVWVQDATIIKISAHSGKTPSHTGNVINGTGKYLIPGLTDAHVHYKDHEQLFAMYDSLYLHYGVTTLIALNGAPKVIHHRDSIRSRFLQGPEIYCSSPAMNDSTLTPAKALTLLAEFKQTGYDFVKIYSNLSKAGFEFFSKHAAAYGLRLLGHIPQRVTTMGVLKGNQELVAHAEEFLYNPPVNYMMGNVAGPTEPDTAFILPIADSVFTYHKAVSPTLIAYYSILQSALDQQKYTATAPLPLSHPVARYWGWDALSIPRKFSSAVSKQRLQSAFNYQLKLVRAFRDKKVLLLAGTDAPTIPGIAPGYSLHQELQFLQQAGLTNFEALQTATTNAAAFLHVTAARGTIREGKEATMVILDKNPLVAIQNTLSVNRVIVKGKMVR